MSFISEALNRRIDPNTAAQNAYAESLRRSRAKKWSILGLAGIVLALATWWLVLQTIAVQQQSNEANQVASTPATPSEPRLTQPPTNQRQPREEPTRPMVIEQPPVSTPVRVQPIVPEPRAPQPAALQRGEGDPLEFRYSSHIYASDPADSALLIGGQELRVGNTFQGWRLKEIAEEGVTWEDQNGEVFVPVLAMWQ